MADHHTDPSLLEALAEHARSVADTDDPRDIAGAQCVAVREVERIAQGLPAALTRSRIYVSADLPKTLVLLAILHELAHFLVEREGWIDTHSDVWRLTLMLAMPRSMCRGRSVEDLAAAAGVPWWAAALRMNMTTVMVAPERALANDWAC